MFEPVWMIESLTKSNRKNKKYKIVFYNLDSFNRITSHFGSKDSKTYINGATDEERMNYIKRHSKREKDIWFDKTRWYAPASLSLRLLWGESKNLNKNIEDYKKHYNIL
tara:strand:+ start:310 stop:636 length:327 start_codon:yes stop_codon:yes gene_type:complete